MSMMLLTMKSGAEATPIRMKTPTGLHLVGFGSQEVGAYCVRRLGLDSSSYDFVDLASHFSSALGGGKKSEPIVFFQSEHDVDMHLQDRSRFPYLEYQIGSDEFEERG